MLVPQLDIVLCGDLPAAQRFNAVLETVGELLQCDRCFLYLRHPQKRLGRTAFCWLKSADLPRIYDEDWKVENPETLEQVDPLFAAALAAKPSVYVEDIETAPPGLLNPAYERKNLGHRALIHGHILKDNELWGILQPCVFEKPRPWRSFDHSVMAHGIYGLMPLVVDYVEHHCPDRA